MSDEREFYSGVSWGMELGSGQPEGQLAELETERAATPQRVAAATRLFKQARLDEFDPIGVTGRKLRHHETGREYVIAQDQVLMERDPSRSGVEFFIVAGDRLWFLRPRGFDGDVERSIPGEIIAGELSPHRTAASGW